MKKIILLILLLLSGVVNSQITVEIISPSGEYRSHTNADASVYLEVRHDSLLIHSNEMVAVYRIDRIVATQPSEGSGFLGVQEIHIIDGSHGLLTVTLWVGIGLVSFEYEDGTQVLNSGEGISYKCL